jgi:hypothetical protein
VRIGFVGYLAYDDMLSGERNRQGPPGIIKVKPIREERDEKCQP